MTADRRQGKPKAPQRKVVESPLGEGSLDDRGLLSDTNYGESIRVLPEVNVIKVGGQSFMDRGRSAVFPLIEEIGMLAGKYQIVVGAGGGTRARHAYSIALELGLPTGVIAAIGASTALQNAAFFRCCSPSTGAFTLMLMTSRSCLCISGQVASQSCPACRRTATGKRHRASVAFLPTAPTRAFT